MARTTDAPAPIGAKPGASAAAPATALRSIASLPFKTTLSSKALDEAIRQVMAKRSADTVAAVRVAVAGATGKPAAAAHRSAERRAR